MDNNLINKYNIPGPRYTSYPAVPHWEKEEMNTGEWINTLQQNFSSFGKPTISLYVHLPYCESLCTFCGCHKRITKNHSVEGPYIDALIREWELYKGLFPFEPTIKELHFGGGTPTFFQPDQLVRLVQALFYGQKNDDSSAELSFEAHPSNTTEKHLSDLYAVGFRRLSLGIQDYSPHVQQAIHRIQTYEEVALVHNLARTIGYSSISHDLVFGLPKQTIEDISSTVAKTLILRPDRISLYSYAHVPWIKGNGQRGFNESDLPVGDEKRALYNCAKAALEKAGYLEIGMDHFALPNDAMAQAFLQKRLHRNFMGYTTQNTSLLIGLGMSAISDSWFGFAQNDKSVESYISRVNEGKIPVFRGHLLSAIDVIIRRHILDLMCHFETTFTSDAAMQSIYTSILQRLQSMLEDELITCWGNTLKISDKGIPFVRNACMAFDQYLTPSDTRKPMFSQTV
jgi:oxygen-independent coproporphyrinogen-3 oxidase